MNRFVLLSLCGLSMFSFGEELDPFQADLELGVLVSSGNTENSTFKSVADIRQDFKRWKNQFLLEGVYMEDEIRVDGTDNVQSQTTAQRFFASAQTDRKLSEDYRGLFVFASYLDDRFSGFEYQATLAAGYSDRLFRTKNSFLNYSIGPGVSSNKTEDNINNGVLQEGETSTLGVVRLAVEYKYQLSDNAKFSQTVSSDLSIDAGENSRTRSESALSANINSSMAMKLSYLINHNTHPPTNRRSADTQTAVTLVFTL